MYKKLICCITSIALLLSVIFPTAAFIAAAADLFAATGEDILYNFDDVAEVSDAKWISRFNNGGMTVSLETAADNVYGGTGKSLKLQYDTSIKKDGNLPAIKLVKNIDAKGDGFSFWLKSDAATNIVLAIYDADGVHTTDPIAVEAAGKVYNIPYTAFSGYDPSKAISQINIRTKNANEQNIIYFDNFGYYGEVTPSTPTTPPEAATGDKLLYGFDDVADVTDAEWVTRFTNGGMTVSLETTAANVYGGTGKSLKLQYDTSIKKDGNLPAIKLVKNIDAKGDGFSFWLKSDAATNIVLAIYDADGVHTTDPIAVEAAGKVYNIPYTAFSGYDPSKAISQINIRTKNANEQNIIYFDNFGYYGEVTPSTPTTPPEAATGHKLISGFDDVADVSGAKWVSKYDNGGMTLDLETDVANVYGDSGKSLKLVYDTSIKDKNGNLPAIKLVKNIKAKGDGFTFWLKSDAATSVVLGVYAGDANKLYKTGNIAVDAGEKLYFVPYSDLSGYNTADVINQIDLRTNKKDQTNTLYFDNFGYYGEVEPEQPPVVPSVISEHTSDFTEVATDAAKWVTGKKNVSATLSVEDNSPYYHKGVTNLGTDTKALKLAYTSLPSDKSKKEFNFYYDSSLEMNAIAPYIYETDSVLSFWVRADQPLNLTITYSDYDNVSGKGAQAPAITKAIPAGESIVRFNMKDFVKEGIEFGYRYVKQLQFTVTASADSFDPDKGGELYIDALGFYDLDPTNDIPDKPETPTVPDTVAKHEIGFTEVELDETKWVNKQTANTTIKYETESKHYHNGDKTTDKSATRIDYKSISPSKNIVNFYYNDRIQISKSAPYTFGETSVFTFWAYTEQSVDIKITYMDYSNDTKKSFACKALNITLPIGESIVKIPMKDLIPDGANMGYRYVYQLQFAVTSNDDSYLTSSSLWLDAFGFYDSALVVNYDPIDVPSDAYIWWNFDHSNSLEDLEDQWTFRFEGDTGEGIKTYLETNTDNVYGGKGNSIKAVYNRKLAKNNIPALWHEKRMATLGDGLVFWIKSEEKTTLRLVCTDANNIAVVVDAVPITIGYNVVRVKWSDFKFMQKDQTGVPAMSSIAQLQIRFDGCNSGTIWLDQIGFTNVVNDGSNAYYSIYPPTSYADWEEGESSRGDNFDQWPSENDYKFCCEWYFNTDGWVALEKNGDNQIIRMDYDLTDGKRSELTNVTKFAEVDPNGGISFWAKSTDERYYTLKVSLGSQVINVIFKGDTKGRTYKIPFSAFWVGNRTDRSFEATSIDPLSVTRLVFLSDSTCNPPSIKTADKFSLYVDDIKFVDSYKYKRASEVDYTENGVTLKASAEAFSSGVTPKIDNVEITEDKISEYLSKAKGASKILAHKYINVTDVSGKNPIPQVAVELIFDVPEGQKAENIGIYQLFVDGSLVKRNVKVGDDGKIHAQVYRLGDYVMTLSENTSKPSTNTNSDANTDSKASFPWVTVVIVLGAIAVLAGGTVAVIKIKKGRVTK